ncbi:anti-sigma factor domain-containing protein [Thalassovita sp.]|uniref:anti-sigma factor n=1 Tax=Thalassovita sp. TaxID=1979401 RepID=UPI002B26A83D|nr:anti-sigma factor [Thalassovita sp.]
MTDTGNEMDDDALAGEYALRLLSREDTRRFETRMAQDPALAALVRDWQARLAPMADELTPEVPPRHVKRALEARLFPDSARRMKVTRRLWMGITGGAVFAALAAFLLLLPQIQSPGFVPQYSAELMSEAEGLRLTAGFDPDSGTLILTRMMGEARPGRVQELWLIAEGEPAPVSLGVLADTTEIRLDVPADLIARLPGATLAISDEPPGGSPTGQPTGDVLAAAPVVKT